VHCLGSVSWWRCGAFGLVAGFGGHVPDGVGEGVATKVAVPTEHLPTGATFVGLVVGVRQEMGF